MCLSRELWTEIFSNLLDFRDVLSVRRCNREFMRIIDSTYWKNVTQLDLKSAIRAGRIQFRLNGTPIFLGRSLEPLLSSLTGVISIRLTADLISPFIHREKLEEGWNHFISQILLFLPSWCRVEAISIGNQFLKAAHIAFVISKFALHIRMLCLGTTDRDSCDMDIIWTAVSLCRNLGKLEYEYRGDESDPSGDAMLISALSEKSQLKSCEIGGFDGVSEKGLAAALIGSNAKDLRYLGLPSCFHLREFLLPLREAPVLLEQGPIFPVLETLLLPHPAGRGFQSLLEVFPKLKKLRLFLHSYNQVGKIVTELLNIGSAAIHVRCRVTDHVQAQNPSYETEKRVLLDQLETACPTKSAISEPNLQSDYDGAGVYWGLNSRFIITYEKTCVLLDLKLPEKRTFQALRSFEI